MFVTAVDSVLCLHVHAFRIPGPVVLLAVLDDLGDKLHRKRQALFRTCHGGGSAFNVERDSELREVKKGFEERRACVALIPLLPPQSAKKNVCYR
jgi:hypothetical protein